VEKAQQQEGYYEQLVAVNQSEIACIPKLIPLTATKQFNAITNGGFS